jgi:hypothetical protein
MLVVFLIFYQTTWIETTQSDFRDGWFEGNLYASVYNGGAVEFVSRWDLNGDGYLDIVVCNEQSSISYIYWGSTIGYLVRTEYPVNGAQGCEVSDINLDGYPELFCTDPGAGSSIVRMFWGSPTGPDPSSYIDYTVPSWNESCYLNDFNKDGRIDLAIGRYSSGIGVIFYLSQTGSIIGADTFPSFNGINHLEAADFNKDSWLDLLNINGNNCAYLFWGSPQGYIPTNRTDLAHPSGTPRGPAIADFDNNGYLDIVISVWNDGDSAYVYYYDSIQFLLSAKLHPGHCLGGATTADLDNDGYLDILFLKGYGFQEFPYIYWGSATGFTDANRSPMGRSIDCSGALIADFNRDDHLDVLLCNYSVGSYDYICYGSNFAMCDSVANIRDNHSRFKEIGNTYDRTYREDYISSIYDANGIADWGTVEWDDSLPIGSAISFNIRTGDTPNPDMLWSGWIVLSNGDSFPDSLNARYTQYKAIFSYQDPCFLPYLYETRISITTTEINEHQYHQIARPQLNIAPNPAVGCINIDYSVMKDDGNITLKIFDNSGQCVASMLENNHGKGRHTLSWSGRDDNGEKLPQGVYFVEVRQSESYLRKKIILLVP